MVRETMKLFETLYYTCRRREEKGKEGRATLRKKRSMSPPRFHVKEEWGSDNEREGKGREGVRPWQDNSSG